MRIRPLSSTAARYLLSGSCLVGRHSLAASQTGKTCDPTLDEKKKRSQQKLTSSILTPTTTNSTNSTNNKYTMPKSKRNKVISLTKTGKKPGRENNERLFNKIRESIDQYQTCLVFSIENMRNTHLKEVRTDLSDSRCVFAFNLPELKHLLTQHA